LKSVAIEEANGGTPLAATGTVALPISNFSRRRFDNLTKRRARTKFHEAFQFFHERFARRRSSKPVADACSNAKNAMSLATHG